MDRRMPAEWEPHAATWIAWPHHEPDWPGKLDAVRWDYAEIARVLHRYEPVEIICHDDSVREAALDHLQAHHVHPDRYRLHTLPTDRVWLRDSAPTGVLRGDGSVEWINWAFNAWSKYDNYSRDALVGRAIAGATGHERTVPEQPHSGEPLVLEGGGIDVDGVGSLLVTEEWLLTDVQVRNHGLTREDYEHAFRKYLGVTNTIWLGDGAVGDDTHGHVDDIARFAPHDTILLAVERDPADENHQRSMDNLRRLEVTPAAKRFRVVELPFPRPLMMRGERLPASYANFYACNGAVLVPTFNDPADQRALGIIADAFPSRDVIGIHAVNLVWGLGTLHCLTQQQPAPVPVPVPVPVR
jgi:agmatine deiminase